MILVFWIRIRNCFPNLDEDPVSDFFFILFMAHHSSVRAWIRIRIFSMRIRNTSNESIRIRTTYQNFIDSHNQRCLKIWIFNKLLICRAAAIWIFPLLAEQRSGWNLAAWYILLIINPMMCLYLFHRFFSTISYYYFPFGLHIPLPFSYLFP
jgi:hypothetical protein